MTTTALRAAFCGLMLAVFAGGDWPGFRGPDGRGVSNETGLPTTFGENENIAWKVPLPGTGPSSPIFVGGRVIVTAASGPRQDVLHILAFDAESGETVWHRQLWATGSSLANSFGGVAANTPAADGQSIFAFFSSGDLACFDFDGNLRWFRGLGSDYPNARNDVGLAASPVVVGSTVIVQMECLGDSFAAGLDTDTGVTRWRIPREKGSAWCSPTVLRTGTPADAVVLLQSRSSLTANDPLTGRQLWDFETGCHTIATVTADDGIAYLPANGLTALRPKAEGGVELLWHEPKLRSGRASPIVWQGRAYTIKSPGILVCGDADDGRVLWQVRLKGDFWASAAVADGHLFAVNQDGLVQVVRLGEDKGEVVGTGELGQTILASPAVADGAIFFRSNEFLWKAKQGASPKKP